MFTIPKWVAYDIVLSTSYWNQTLIHLAKKKPISVHISGKNQAKTGLKPIHSQVVYLYDLSSESPTLHRR